MLINIIVVVATVKVIAVVLIGESCGGLWLRPLSQDLFSPRVLAAGTRGGLVAIRPIDQRPSLEILHSSILALT